MTIPDAKGFPRDEDELAQVLGSLRDLRRRTVALRTTVVDDLRSFIRSDGLSFRRLPDSNNTKPEASVATTCSALMALSLAGRLGDVYRDTSTNTPSTTPQADSGKGSAKKRGAGKQPKEQAAAVATAGTTNGKTTSDQVLAAVELMMRSAWDSSELPPDNAFTRAILLRTLGMLAKHKSAPQGQLVAMKKQDLSAQERGEKIAKLLEKDGGLKDVHQAVTKSVAKLPATRSVHTLAEVVQQLAVDLPGSLKVLDYLPTPTLGYWFVAGVEELGLALNNDGWIALARWARDDVARQIGLITANHDARMDPVAMAMAACLAARLRRIALRVDGPAPARLVDELPTTEELKTAIRLLFAKQGSSGIWPKYFPLFHYPSAGANYCFSFELLEAVLHELVDPEFLLEKEVLAGFERAVSWCELNRLEHLYQGQTYRGWNSGGELTTLSQSIPESWATAVVHMFAFELEAALNNTIGELVLRKYRSDKPTRPNKKKLESFIDIEVKLHGQITSVKTILLDEVVTPAAEQASGRLFRLRKRWSALLFGPPGTSKTSLVKAIAAYLGWPYVEINPSDFLKRGLELLPIQANEIFDDLMDLSKVVVLFDEMDAIVKRREQKNEEEPRLDPTSELLTTSMLPKLAKLHENAQAVFFFATNHRRDLDNAITRPGRFDLWLCMGPPKWSEKLKNLEKILGRFDVAASTVENARKRLAEWTSTTGGASPDLEGQLDFFTFAEVQSFLEYVCRKTEKPIKEIDLALEKLNGEGLRNDMKEWYTTSITLHPESRTREEYDLDLKESKIQ